MKRRSSLLACCFMAALLTGCGGSVGKFQQSTVTGLSGNNYKIIKAGAVGTSRGFFLVGILPIVGSSFAEAKADLYESSGQSLEGRSIALANDTEDTSVRYLVLFSVPKLTITADIVEFTGPK